MPFLILPILWIATAAGRRIVGVALGPSRSTSWALERILFGAAAGLVILGYGMLALGLAGQFRISAAAIWLAILAILGWREHLALAQDIALVAKAKFSLFSLCVTVLAAMFALFALVGCLTPPYPLEWDSMSYHLTDPNIYVRHGRIVPLPWESHSNFAFTMEMLYSIGMMVKSTALAKLFHFSMAFIAALGVWQIGRRHLSAKCGALSALLFVSLPLVFWEAGTAYVDLAATAFGVLGFLALLNALKLDSPRWLVVTTVMLGCMVSIKATSAITAFLYGVIAAVWIYRRTQLASGSSNGALREASKVLIAMGLGAFLIGSPWYIKSWVVTGNPVYPFAYSVFGGKNWDQENARIYTRDQQAFGIGHAEGGVRLPLVADILTAPWNLTMFSMPGHPPPAGSKANPFNDFPSPLVSLTPLFLATLLVIPFRRGGVPVAIRVSLAVCAATLVFWAPATQQVRYLFPIYPLLSLIAGYVTLTLLSERRVAGFALAGLGVVSIGFSMYIGQTTAQQIAPVAIGRETREDFLHRSFRTYRAFEYLNTQPPGSGVVLYGEPLGLYCNQPFMWGEPTHGRVIPYDSLTSPDDLRRYLIDHGFRFILVNTSGATLIPAPDGRPPVSWSEKVAALTQVAPVYDNGNPLSPIRIYPLQ
ncbi:MAG TPA: glycosyltransferase family 39 protein [Capsulimonadaceae bacterium]|jgi:hypothetical protein